MYFKGKPLYPFGYGLSYTTFRYLRMSTTSPVLKKNGELKVVVDVQNTGARSGEEVVQLYVTHVKSKVPRPMKELKAFMRVLLQPGQVRSLQIPLKAESLAYWDETQDEWVVEEEPVKIMVGRSSAAIQLSQIVKVER
jgi:beta-glucosidase